MSNRQLCIHYLRLHGPIVVAIVLMFFISRVHADYEEGVEAVFSGDFDTAFREFSTAAAAGLDLAQYNLAILYFTGQGTTQDFEQAFKWTQAAALQGHVDAQFNLGSLYLDGSGITKSTVRGIDWLASAARAGHANAAFALAMMYLEGDPIPQDEVLAHAWAAKAANNDHAQGLDLKKEIEAGLSQADLSTARRTFARWQIEAVPALPAQ